MKIRISNVCSAFEANTIGSKVIDPVKFLDEVSFAILNHDASKDRVPGQMFLQLSAFANAYVSAGVGLRTDKVSDYVLREHRGQVSAFLGRHCAATVEKVAVVVYTREAYLNDPDVQNEPAEVERVKDADYVVVAVLAYAGPEAPLSPFRFVHNLAGGNREAATWTLEEVVTKAKQVAEYDKTWCVVAG